MMGSSRRTRKLVQLICAEPESFVRGGQTVTLFFLVAEGREDPNATKKLAFRWRADIDPTLNAGLVHVDL